MDVYTAYRKARDKVLSDVFGILGKCGGCGNLRCGKGEELDVEMDRCEKIGLGQVWRCWCCDEWQVSYIIRILSGILQS